MNAPGQALEPAPRNQQVLSRDTLAEPDGDYGTTLIDFVELKAIVARNKWWMLASIVLTLAIAAVLTAFAVPQYRAETTLEVDSRQANILDVEDVEAETATRDNEEFLQTQLEILRSRSIAQAVAEDLGLIDNDEFLVAMGATPSDETDDSAAVVERRKNRVVDVLLQNQQVNLVPQSRIVEISFVSPNPPLAARVADSYASSYIEDSLTRRFAVTRYARQFVGEQLAQTRENLENSEKNLNTYARNAGIVSTGSDSNGQPNGSLTNATISQTNQELVDARADRIQTEQGWRAVQNTPPLSIPAVYSNPAVSQLIRRRAELRAELAEASSRYVDDAPQVQEVRSELNQIDSELNSLASQIKSSIQRGYEASVGRERQLEQTVSDLTSRQQDEQSRGVQYNILNRDVATNRALYDGLLQRYRELTASAGLTGNNITVVDEAEIPRQPFSPQPVRNMLIALLLGLILAGVVAYLREQILQRIRTPDDARKAIGLPLLGAVPKPSAGSMDDALDENLSNVSEAMSTLTSVLSLSSASGAPASIFVTSGRSGEGKSSTGYSVAKNLARRGAKVLVVDADMRRPNMHKLFGLRNEAGLSDYLSGQTDWSNVVHTPASGRAIDVITAGQIPPSPVDLLASPRFDDLIGKGQAQYDHVIVDGPPVLGLSDALIIASKVEATIFAIEAGAWRPAQSRDMIRKLSQSARSLVGVILTKFDARESGYEYYYAEGEYEYAANTN